MSRRSLVLRGVLLATLTGCGYTSQYTPPVDGRARPLWSEDRLTYNVGQLGMTAGCTEKLYWTAHPERERRGKMAEQVAFWVPVYYGSEIVVARPGVAPLFPQPVFSPSLKVSQREANVAVRVASGDREGSVEELGIALDAGRTFVYLMVVFVLWPVIAVGLAAARPESIDVSARAIDEANAYNDLARTAGTPCSYRAP